MTFLGVPVDASQIAGGLAFASASALCAAVFATLRRQGAGTAPRADTWLVLAGLHLAFAFEVVLGARYRLHDVADALLRARGWYASRAVWQITMIVALLAAATALGRVIGRRMRRDPGAAGACLGTLAAAALFALETISLHQIDTLMYEKDGPIVGIAWMWLAAAGVVIASALFARQRIRQGAAATGGTPRDRR